MEKPSEWKKAVAVFYAVEVRATERFGFPVRGASPQEIAHYLLKEKKALLRPSEEKFLKQLINPHNLAIANIP
jgi:hypothetical protein